MLSRIQPFINRILLTLLPPHCVLCTRPSNRDSNLCSGCEQDLPILPQTCPNFAHIFALFPYQQPIIKLITGLKFNHNLTHARALGELMANKAPEWYAGKQLPDMLIPIPLHPLRMRERGFNQALEIARPVSRALDIPIDCNGTKRTRHTARQSDLPARRRGKNVANAFTCSRDYHGKHIAIIDDVVTTGSTVKTFREVLEQAGARQVDIWCCARVV